MASDPEAMEDALRTILAWAEAYPQEAFAQPDLLAIREKIGDGPFSALHGTWARHLLDGVVRYARAGLAPVPADRHADLIARLGRFAAADRSNASKFPEGPVRDGMSRRAQVMEEAIAELGGTLAAAEAPPAPLEQDEVVVGDEAASRVAPTRA